MKGTRRFILWLPSWYPNRYDPFDGDFIQRHAQAAALYDDIHVLFVLFRTEQIEAEEVLKKKHALTEQIIYVPKKTGLSGQLKNLKLWSTVYHSRITALIKERPPHLVHVHVPWKAGLVALWIKKKFHFSYIITEHWGIYNNIVADNFYKRSFAFRFLMKLIFRNAKGFISVSQYLAERIQNMLANKFITVVPNVVDTSIFTEGEEKNRVFTFLHVSNMVPLKNVEGILVAFLCFLQQTDVKAQLVMIGNKNNNYPQIASKMKFPADAVVFKGEIPYYQVAREMQSSHVLILNSNIENSPCVISEALCCGLPVIATNVGGIPELVPPNSGLLVHPGSVAELTKAMIKMYDTYGQYNSKALATASSKIFSPDVIGAMHHHLYHQLT